MRVITIDPTERRVRSEYHDIEQDQRHLNLIVGAMEIMCLSLGRNHALWVDSRFTIRKDQNWFSIIGSNGAIMGGKAVITGFNPSPDADNAISSCQMPCDGVEQQIIWATPEEAIQNEVIASIHEDNELIEFDMMPPNIYMFDLFLQETPPILQ